MTQYSLSDYILSVQIPEELRDVFSTSAITSSSDEDNIISIGGEQSYLGSITIHLDTNNTFSVEGDNTGSYVVNKNLNKSGSISITINQVSDKVKTLIRLFETYYSADTITEGMTITVSHAIGGGNQEMVAMAKDCYLNLPDQVFGNEATTQSWSFVCGRIDFGGNIN